MHFSRGHGDFHFRWLRHNCDEDRHPRTAERTLCSSEPPDDVAPCAPRSLGGALLVTWAHDGRSGSRYPLRWLEQHAYARDRLDVPPPPADVTSYEIDGRARGLASIVEDAVRGVRERGAAVVRRSSTEVRSEEETEAIIEAIERQGLQIIGTHFGRIEDLRVDNTTNANTDQLGYTDAPVHVHTDQPFLDEPPRYPAPSSRSAGPTSAARERHRRRSPRRASPPEPRCRGLRAAAAHAGALFTEKQKAFERVVESPLFTFEPAFRIRCSYFTVAPYQLPRSPR